MIRRTVSVLAAALLISPPQVALAQAPSQTSPAQPASASSQQLLSAGQLDALVAPIALYPDALLSEMLMASTYPLEVVEADRWVKANGNLKGDALKAAVDKQTWDDSVKSLVATPDVLDMMSQKLSWTQQVGDAVLAQQPDVMDAIQRLRTKAQANNKLTSNKQQKVATEQQGGKEIIVIAPAEPDTLYVPYYDPAVVYGPWPYPAYPPYYWPAPGYIAGGVIAAGIAFGAGYALGRWAGGGYWGGGFNWGGNNININRNVNINNINRGNGNNWAHNPAHRQGVRYSNANVANKFGGNNISGAQNRMDFRGRGGNQVLQPGGGAANRPNVGGGAGGNRPNAGVVATGRVLVAAIDPMPAVVATGRVPVAAIDPVPAVVAIVPAVVVQVRSAISAQEKQPAANPPVAGLAQAAAVVRAVVAAVAALGQGAAVAVAAAVAVVAVAVAVGDPICASNTISLC